MHAYCPLSAIANLYEDFQSHTMHEQYKTCTRKGGQSVFWVSAYNLTWSSAELCPQTPPPPPHTLDTFATQAGSHHYLPHARHSPACWLLFAVLTWPQSWACKLVSGSYGCKLFNIKCN